MRCYNIDIFKGFTVYFTDKKKITTHAARLAMAFFRPVAKSFPRKLCPLLSLAAMCASIAYCNKRSPCSWRRVSWILRGAGNQEEGVGFYLSFSKQDIGDDVRETAAQHQHHAVLAVSDTRHLRRGDTITSSSMFMWNLHRGVLVYWPLLPGGCRNTFCRRRAGLAGRRVTTSCDTTNNTRAVSVTARPHVLHS